MSVAGESLEFHLACRFSERTTFATHWANEGEKRPDVKRRRAIYPSGWLQNESPALAPAVCAKLQWPTLMRAIIFGVAAKCTRCAPPRSWPQHPCFAWAQKLFLSIFSSCNVRDEICVAHGAGANDTLSLSLWRIDWLHISALCQIRWRAAPSFIYSEKSNNPPAASSWLCRFFAFGPCGINYFQLASLF